MMIEDQPLTNVDRAQLPAKVGELKAFGHRMIQVCATTLPENFEITYSFEKDQKFINLRVTVPRSDAVIPSITGVYFGALTYENELQDLFGRRIALKNLLRLEEHRVVGGDPRGLVDRPAEGEEIGRRLLRQPQLETALELPGTVVEIKQV